jgi:hypothetical protein
MPQFNFDQWVRPGTFEGPTANDLENSIKSQFAKIVEIANEAEARLQRINQNTKLSREGKMEQAQEVLDQYKHKIDKSVPWEGIDTQRQKMESRIAEPPLYEKGDVEGLMRLREIRDRLHAMNPADAMQAYLKAHENGDQELIEAVEKAPRSFQLVPQDRIDEMRQRRLEQKFPNEVAGVRDYTNYKNYLSTAAQLTKDALDRMVR